MADGEYSELRSKVVVTSDTSGLDKVTEGIKEAKQAADDLSKSANTAGSSIGKLGKVGETLEKINEQIGESKTAKFTTSIEDSGLVAQKTLIEDIGERMDELSNKTFDSSNSPARIMTPEMAREIADSTTKLDLLKMKANDATEAYIRLVREGKTGKQVTSALEAMQKATAAYEAELEKVYSHQAHQLVPLISPDQAEEFARQIGETQRLSANLEYAKGKLAGFLDKWAQGDTSSKTAKNIADWSVKVNNLREKLTAAISANTAFASGAGNVASQAGNAAENVNEYASATERLGQAAINAPQENLALPAPATNTGGMESAGDEVVRTFSEMGNRFSWLANIGGAVQSVLSGLPGVLRGIASTAGSAASMVGGFVKTMGQRAMSSIKKFTGGLGNIINSFKRIAFYRFIRSVIRAITEGFKEGVNNLYQWSKAVNGQFAKSMDTISTATLYMKNSLGAMVAPLINAIAPAIDFLIDKFVALLNVINRVFALLTGAGTWIKAKKYPKEYADSVSSGAGKATEALHKLGLAQIDELTILDKNHGDTGSGGGGGSGMDYSSMFEEQDIGGGIWDKIKEAIESGKWREAGKILAEQLNEIVKNFDAEGWGKKIGEKINNGLEFAYGFLKFTDFQQIGGKIAEFINGGLEKINFNTAGRLMTRKVTALYDTIIGFVTRLDWGLVGKSISDYIIGSFSEWNEWLEGIDWYKLGTDLRIKFEEMVAKVDWDTVGQEVIDFFKNAVDAAVRLGVGIILPIDDVGFEARNVKANELIEKIKNCLNPVTLGLIGWTLGGPGGAVLGAVIGLGLSFALKTDLVEDADKYGERVDKVVVKHNRIVRETVDQTGAEVSSSTGRHFGEVESKINSSLSSSSSIVHNKTGDISSEISKQWGEVEEDTDSGWSGIVKTIGDWIEKAKQKLNFKWSFPKIDLPHIPSPHFSWTTGIAGIPIPHFDGWWAQGGFPQEGSLFIAREAGAEMVGSMGGRTAVANNDQIVEGISQGVYAAVKSALGDGSNSVNVYLDGKQISGTVVSNINSETRRTGSSPLLSF